MCHTTVCRVVFVGGKQESIMITKYSSFDTIIVTKQLMYYYFGLNSTREEDEGLHKTIGQLERIDNLCRNIH